MGITKETIKAIAREEFENSGGREWLKAAVEEEFRNLLRSEFEAIEAEEKEASEIVPTEAESVPPEPAQFQADAFKDKCNAIIGAANKAAGLGWKDQWCIMASVDAQRRALLEARAADMGEALMLDVVRAYAQSDFFRGVGAENGRKTNLDWVFASKERAMAALEGKYANGKTEEKTKPKTAEDGLPSGFENSSERQRRAKQNWTKVAQAVGDGAFLHPQEPHSNYHPDNEAWVTYWADKWKDGDNIPKEFKISA